MPIYFFREITDDGGVKIGYSKTPMTRQSNLQTGNSKELRFLGSLRGGKKEEKHFHKILESFRTRGEFFDPACLDLIFPEVPVCERCMSVTAKSYRCRYCKHEYFPEVATHLEFQRIPGVLLEYDLDSEETTIYCPRCHGDRFYPGEDSGVCLSEYCSTLSTE